MTTLLMMLLMMLMMMLSPATGSPTSPTHIQTRLGAQCWQVMFQTTTAAIWTLMTNGAFPGAMPLPMPRATWSGVPRPTLPRPWRPPRRRCTTGTWWRIVGRAAGDRRPMHGRDGQRGSTVPASAMGLARHVCGRPHAAPSPEQWLRPVVVFPVACGDVPISRCTLPTAPSHWLARVHATTAWWGLQDDPHSFVEAALRW